MKVCETCKAAIEEGAVFCPQCGCPIPADSMADAEERVHKLLTEANLNRIRGNYDDAIDNCTEALKSAPSDPDIHSMLGDIYESAGKLEESVRWYQMAIELRPDCALDAAKLERLRSRLKRIKHGPQPDITTGNWTSEFLGENPHHDAGLRKIVIFSVIAVLILFAFGAMAWYLKTISAGNRSHLNMQPAPQSKKKSTSEDSTQQPLAPSTTPTIIEQGNKPLPRPLGEQQILSNLATNPDILARRLTVEDVKQDPRNEALLISVRLPESAEPLTQQQALKAAGVVASAAFTVSANTSMVTIRELIAVPSKYGSSEPQIILVCDAVRQASGLNFNQATGEQLSGYFANVWWGAELAD